MIVVRNEWMISTVWRFVIEVRKKKKKRFGKELRADQNEPKWLPTDAAYRHRHRHRIQQHTSQLNQLLYDLRWV